VEENSKELISERQVGSCVKVFFRMRKPVPWPPIEDLFPEC